MITNEELTEWMERARPGDWLTYHTGPHLFGLQGKKRPAASTLLALSNLGQVFLCQRRGAVRGEFEYRAMRLDESLRRKVKSWSS